MGHRLVFGDDHSVGAQAAWSWVNAHTWTGWAAEVLTVNSDSTRLPDDPSTHAVLRPWQPPHPRQAAPRSGLRSVTHVTAEGDAWRVLSAQDASLVVVGSRGKGLLKALRVSSTAEHLLRSPTAPLIIARTTDSTRSVLVCVDGSAASAAAVSVLASFPWAHRATITVLGVSHWEDDLAGPVQQSADTLAAVGARVVKVVTEPLPLKVAVAPELAIFEYVDATAPDLVVLGTSGRTGLARMWMGSVASAVTHHATCSVLIARARADADLSSVG